MTAPLAHSASPAAASGPAFRINGREVPRSEFYAVACNPQSQVVVEACAGSGKTWMLVARIVRALLAGATPQEVLAITFTRRAAAEMSARLDEALAELEATDDAKRLETLCAYGLTPAQAQQQAAAAKALRQRVLAQARPMQVRTFHSWFTQLVKGAPLAVLHRLGLSPDAEVVEADETLQPLLWRRFLGRVNRDERLRAVYVGLVQGLGRSKTQTLLEALWAKRVEFRRADAAGVVTHSVPSWQQAFPGVAALTPVASGSPAGALLAQRTQWAEWAQALGQEKNSTPQKAATAIERAFTELQQTPDQLAQALRKAILVKDEPRLHQHLQKFPAAQAAEQSLCEVLLAQQQHAAWQLHHAAGELMRAWLDEYALVKRERSLMDMTDLEEAAVELLSDADTQAWMAERLGSRTKHLLIDEFQDTNPLQWRALSGWLSGYAGAGGGAELYVFVVGDPKQSIYAFRRADPAVFAAAVRFVREGLGGQHLACDHTRRCSAAVVQGVNAVFGAAQSQGAFAGFRPHTTERVHGEERPTLPNASPAVACLPKLARDAAEAQARSAWRDSLTEKRREPKTVMRQTEAARAARLIAHWVRHEGLKPADVLVLARKHAGFEHLPAELRALGIASQVREKALLADALEVQDLLALLDVLTSQHHDLALAQVLRSPLFAAADEDLIALASAVRAARPGGGPPPSWWQALMAADWPQHPALQRAAGLLPAWATLAQALPPHDVLDAIYAQGDVLPRYAAAVPAAQRASVVANLRELLLQALQLDGGRFATPYGFVRALRRVNAARRGRTTAPPKAAVPVVGADTGRVPGADGADPGAVHLLTMHGAKGLEAKAVVVMDTHTSTPKTPTLFALIDWPAESAHPRRFAVVETAKAIPRGLEAVWADEQAKVAREQLNTLYVAMTRAEDRLVFSASEPYQSPDPASHWAWVQGHVEEAAAPDAGHAGREAGASQDVGDALPMLRWLALPTLPPRWKEQPTHAAPLDPPTDEASANAGRALHRLLEWAAAMPESRALNEAAARAVRREFGLSPEAVALALHAARAIFTAPAMQPFWRGTEQAYNELSLHHNGQVLRLDRLVKLATGPWWVLDYKLGHAPQANPAYREQVAAYVQAVRALKPGEEVRGALVSGSGEVFEVSV